tara:strand:- start:386 stop:814 length:429 start_codon:yes stop_codon:yes gene_type:complete
MIVFDLICDSEHTFEAWFKDSKTFDRQRRKGEVACPVCDSTKVEKALMAPNITTAQAKDRAASTQKTVMAAQMLQMLSEARKAVEENCDYVGPNFAEEARKIHHGEVDKRDIYGEATKEEAEELQEEGVEFGLLPWVPRMDN